MNDIDERFIEFLKEVKKNGIDKFIEYCEKNWDNEKTTKEEYNKII